MTHEAIIKGLKEGKVLTIELIGTMSKGSYIYQDGFFKSYGNNFIEISKSSSFILNKINDLARFNNETELTFSNK